ncbi:hypothetical protein [Aliiroseovarius lamellibrachiae]|uniref:hypothetical protein n=1 Tax=Aliiroseovarius lamellibrachiae TaxID=1924933 RepID=UPI001BDFBE00|nr:hypothetical protein [Aliiroseovarius lamellibrachiae]MBT2131511.1 hypothetical protein [Aliiroseovarius lamellibrachiae]
MKILNSVTFVAFFDALKRGDLGKTNRYFKEGLFILSTRIRRRLTNIRKRPAVSKPDKKSAQHYLAEAQALLWRWEIPTALAAANRSIGALYRNGAAHRLNSILLEYSGDLPAAKRAAIAALHSDPLNPQSFKLLQKHDLHDELITGADALRAIVETRNWSRHSVVSAIKCYLEIGSAKDAKALIDEALEKEALTDNDETKYLQGLIHFAMQDFISAIHAFQPLVDTLAFGRNAGLKIGECHMGLGQFERAYDAINDEIIRMNPNKPRGFNTSMHQILFMRGECRRAFLESRERPFTAALRDDTEGNYVQYASDLRHADEVVILADFGVGDEIRFASVYDDVIQDVPHATFTCDPRIVTLLERSFPRANFLPVKRWREEMLVSHPESRNGIGSQRLTPHLNKEALNLIEKAGAFTSIFDMLAEFRPTHADFGKQSSYLKADPDLSQHWKREVASNSVAGKPNIALSWRSILRQGGRNIHYLDVEDLAPLADTKAVFWLFQSQLEEAEVEAIQHILPNVCIPNGLDLMDDFEGQAAFLKNMDYVVAPCTTTAELSGALGVPTFLFGRTHGARTRLHNDSVDIWHPSMRGILSDPIGDKPETARAIAEALEECIPEENDAKSTQ